MARRTLPVETTSFVGREADLLALEQAFAAGARLVTVVGPPGIGKSRLALRHAARAVAAGAHRKGVLACELVDATSAEDLCASLSRALDIALPREQRGGDIVAELAARLGDVLVLLDNVEQLVAVGPETIGRWLALAPQARFLATSRERLRLAGEVVRELGPLSLPAESGDAAVSEAVQLFIERARALRPQFAVSAENEAAIAQVVRELDGIPLAIELGAARMGVLSPGKLLERLPRRFDVLSAAIRNPAARQRTLREAIDASFVQLSPAEQSALMQVSVFRGGFTLEAAEAVVDLGEHPGAPPLLDVLQSLIDKSLLIAQSPVFFPDEVRFNLYLSIRDHAFARLEAAGDTGRILERHAAYFVAAPGLSGGELQGPAELSRLRRVALESHNLGAVHRHALKQYSEGLGGGAETALRAALALEPALIRWGPMPNLWAMLDEALRAGGEALPAELRLRGLIARADVARLLGRLHDSLADSEAALALAEAAGDGRSKAVAAVGIGLALRELGRLREAQRWLDSALAGLRAAGARRLEVRARTALERIHTVLGQGGEARVHREELFRLLGSERDRELWVSSLLSAATLAIAEGRLDEAEAHIEQARSEGQDLASPGLEALAMNTLALLRQDQGRLAEARACAEAAIAVARRLGHGRTEGFSEAQLATILAEVGDLVEARAAAARAVALLRDSGDARAIAFFTAILAAIAARLGHAAEAARLFAEAEAALGDAREPMLEAALLVYRAVLEPERAAEVSAAARERAARSHHVRTGLRILERALAERGAPGPAGDDSAARGGALVISPDGRWCRLPGGAEIAFRRGRALRLMLLRLIEERLAAPGHALPLSELFASGWPGERASADALGNRVYVGISRLRKLGFGGLLLSRDDGFLLDPAVPAYRGDRPA